MQRNPTRVTAHDLADENPVVRLRGGMEAIHGVRGHGQSRIKAERNVGSVQVVVDGFGNADHGDSELAEIKRAAQGPVAPDRNEAVKLLALEGLESVLRTIPRFSAGSAPTPFRH